MPARTVWGVLKTAVSRYGAPPLFPHPIPDEVIEVATVIEASPLNFPMTDALRFLPEGPYQNTPGVFSWVGIQHGSDATSGSLNRFDLATMTNTSSDLPGRPGFAFPCKTPGKFVVGCERTLGFFDVESGAWEPFCEGVDQAVENTIINDGLAIGDNLVFGCKDLEFAHKKAGLYLYRGSDSKLICLRDDQICSNGKAIVEDGDQLSLIDIDSPTRTVVRSTLDLQAGTVGEPEVVLDLTEDPAVPDGAILSPDGKSLIVSMFLPSAGPYGETRQYDLESGDCMRVWRTPLSPQNTCPALVEFNGKLMLIITTAVEHMSKDDQAVCSNAGKLFFAETDFDPAGWAPPVYQA
ncbi:SMP-30/gluconolactonase/LRE family protein [Roseiconus lacunae]|uniref:SMP-30/gluconolactonase/LRE family protein n=1 Tax=Roseiconus lacunae TaxID=2605694 RepID=A0ABT7PBX9_9BACT|nr:SMP-30/gluconolactonase/LRE family protein [Roseiconus lacunae]MDM4013982.1 SMP-30/gluconolactonase/LRE family protein [Roseiconus lacunae]